MTTLSAPGLPGTLIKTAFFFRPRLKETDLQEQFAGALDVLAILVALPLVFAGLLWLSWCTELSSPKTGCCWSRQPSL